MSSGSPMRIQQVLAMAGIASRRGCEQIIREGRVTLDGQKITVPGTKITLDQYSDLRIDGERLVPPQKGIYILLHKPDGFICSVSDPQGRPTVLDLLPRGLPRLYPVGRLDFHTEGLLLLTNDGSLTHSLLHPKFHIARVYQAKVEGIPESASLKLLREGMRTGGERMWADRVEVVRRTKRNAWLAIEIRQGKYHQIRRMCERVGHPVLKLKRISWGPIHLGGLRQGKWRWLKPEEIERLKTLVVASEERQMGKKDTWDH